MRILFCVFLLALVPALRAQERAWLEGAWGSQPTGGRVVVETATEILIAQPEDGDEATWAGRPDEPVRYRREGTTLRIQDAQHGEHALRIVESRPKYTTEYREIGGGHYIKSVSPGGRSVTLEDGTRWDMDSRQHFAVAGWNPDDLITVRRSTDDPAFAFEIDNTTQDDGALANLRVRTE